MAAGASVNAADCSRKTALIRAADAGNIEMAKELIAGGAQVNSNNGSYAALTSAIDRLLR